MPDTEWKGEVCSVVLTGEAIDFNVGWSADKDIYVEADKSYNPNN